MFNDKNQVLNCETTWYFMYRLGFMKINNTNLTFSLWHFAKALQRLGSGQRSSGDWPFLFRMLRSAPLAAKKQAIDAALFFSAPWVPSPIINWNHMKRVIILPLRNLLSFLITKYTYIHICVCVVCVPAYICMHVYMNMYVWIRKCLGRAYTLSRRDGHLWGAVLVSVPFSHIPSVLRYSMRTDPSSRLRSEPKEGPNQSDTHFICA